jgi:hypothetical protein
LNYPRTLPVLLLSSSNFRNKPESDVKLISKIGKVTRDETFFPRQKAKLLEVPALLAQVANGLHEWRCLHKQSVYGDPLWPQGLYYLVV